MPRHDSPIWRKSSVATGNERPWLDNTRAGVSREGCRTTMPRRSQSHWACQSPRGTAKSETMPTAELRASDLRLIANGGSLYSLGQVAERYSWASSGNPKALVWLQFPLSNARAGCATPWRRSMALTLRR